jgi:hypothetical protein
MGKRDFEDGSSTVSRFFTWIGRRHAIWQSRDAGNPRPWTTDKIMQQYKFTNVFRQLDKGTVALLDMLERGQKDTRYMPMLDVFNICWYRLFNHYEHAETPGYCYTAKEVLDALEVKYRAGDKIFTSAHMTGGEAGIPKFISYKNSVRELLQRSGELLLLAHTENSMEAMFHALRKTHFVGPFIAYEMVCDMRFQRSIFITDPCDVDTWANVGPGAKRGLRRIGKEPTLSSMFSLWNHAAVHQLPDNVRWHHPHLWKKKRIADRRQYKDSLGSFDAQCEIWPPFELREIEHSLCEFDKYERVRLGQGKPRQKYDGVGSPNA